jgi:hypothetical protein
MALFSVRPTRFDRVIADEVSAHTNPAIEEVSKVLTWGADEHVVCLAAAAWWFYCRSAPAQQRLLSDHLLVCSLTASLLPRALKSLIDQERPDRQTRIGHWRGVPWSGKRYDAFPSGHAVNIGVLASAATLLPPRWWTAVWGFGGLLATTRVVLLAHWPSDVIAGLALGAVTERFLRGFTLGRPARRPEPVRAENVVHVRDGGEVASHGSARWKTIQRVATRRSAAGKP